MPTTITRPDLYTLVIVEERVTIRCRQYYPSHRPAGLDFDRLEAAYAQGGREALQRVSFGMWGVGFGFQPNEIA